MSTKIREDSPQGRRPLGIRQVTTSSSASQTQFNFPSVTSRPAVTITTSLQAPFPCTTCGISSFIFGTTTFPFFNTSTEFPTSTSSDFATSAFPGSDQVAPTTIAASGVITPPTFSTTADSVVTVTATESSFPTPSVTSIAVPPSDEASTSIALPIDIRRLSGILEAGIFLLATLVVGILRVKDVKQKSRRSEGGLISGAAGRRDSQRTMDGSTLDISPLPSSTLPSSALPSSTQPRLSAFRPTSIDTVAANVGGPMREKCVSPEYPVGYAGHRPYQPSLSVSDTSGTLRDTDSILSGSTMVSRAYGARTQNPLGQPRRATEHQLQQNNGPPVTMRTQARSRGLGLGHHQDPSISSFATSFATQSEATTRDPRRFSYGDHSTRVASPTSLNDPFTPEQHLLRLHQSALASHTETHETRDSLTSRSDFSHTTSAGPSEYPRTSMDSSRPRSVDSDVALAREHDPFMDPRRSSTSTVTASTWEGTARSSVDTSQTSYGSWARPR